MDGWMERMDGVAPRLWCDCGHGPVHSRHRARVAMRRVALSCESSLVNGRGKRNPGKGNRNRNRNRKPKTDVENREWKTENGKRKGDQQSNPRRFQFPFHSSLILHQFLVDPDSPAPTLISPIPAEGTPVTRSSQVPRRRIPPRIAEGECLWDRIPTDRRPARPILRIRPADPYVPCIPFHSVPFSLHSLSF